jgi:glutamate racemase
MGKRSRPIGIFDSGVGGLTVFKEVTTLLPQEDIIYLGDTARIPYGTRSPQTIIKYSMKNTKFLLSRGIKLLVVACNTSSAVSLRCLQHGNAIPIIGVIEPGARKAAQVTRNKKVGVIGTEATLRSRAYEDCIHGIDVQIKVFGQPCPLFVPLVEEGWIDNQVTYLTAQSYLYPLQEETIDTLVLGCTHYPLLKDVISQIMGDGVYLVNSAMETAEEVKKVLEEKDLANNEARERFYTFYVTDNADRFIKVGERFLGTELREVREINW